MTSEAPNGVPTWFDRYPLSVRLANILFSARIASHAAACAMPDRLILRLPNVGRVTLKEWRANFPAQASEKKRRLYMEERIAIAYRALNERTTEFTDKLGPEDGLRLKRLLLDVMSVLDGYDNGFDDNAPGETLVSP